MGVDKSIVAREDIKLRAKNMLANDRNINNEEFLNERKIHFQEDCQMAENLSGLSKDAVGKMIDDMNKAEPSVRIGFKKQLKRIFTWDEIPKTNELGLLVLAIKSALKPDEDLEQE